MQKQNKYTSATKNAHIANASEDDIAVFWSRVEKTKTCWLWTHVHDGAGYGLFNWKGKSVKASRFSLFCDTGEIADLFALHSCRNRNCVRPRHLRWGTAKENAADKKRDGTVSSRKGEQNGRAILSEAKVKKIWSLLQQEIDDRHIASLFNVNFWVIANIRRSKIWAHVTKNLQSLRKPTRIINEHTARQIYEYVLQKLCTNKSAAAHFSVSPNVIDTIVTKKNWVEATADLPDMPMRNNKCTAAKVEMMRTHYENTGNAAATARLFSVSRNCVRQYVRTRRWQPPVSS